MLLNPYKKYRRNTLFRERSDRMSFTKSIQPRNINDPANACSNGCKNQTQDVARTSYEANHKAYRNEHSQGC